MLTTALNGIPDTIRQVFYTGRTINATNASRTLISTAPTVGSVLIRDRFGWDRGVGIDYTQPQTNFLFEQKVVVVDVSGLQRTLLANGTTLISGMVSVIDNSDAASVLVQGNITEGDYLVVANGAFFLAPQAIRSDTVANAVTDTNIVLRNTAGIAVFASENVASAALRNVRVGGFGNAPFC